MGIQKNAKDFFGKTAYYDPNKQHIVIYTEGRHPKDILRSYAHENDTSYTVFRR